MAPYELFKKRMYNRARLERNVVRAAEDLVDNWASDQPVGNFGEVEDALIVSVRDYRMGIKP